LVEPAPDSGRLVCGPCRGQELLLQTQKLLGGALTDVVGLRFAGLVEVFGELSLSFLERRLKWVRLRRV
jgi:hypothetical protein